MNAELNHNHGSGNWIAFLFGAAFNLLAAVDLMSIFDHVFQAVFGGIVCLAFKVLGDILSPLWEKYKNQVKEFIRTRNKRKPS